MRKISEEHLISSAKVAVERENKLEKIDGLNYQFNGACPHIGKMSPGCLSCFDLIDFGKTIKLGSSCNLDCIYCHDRPEKRKRSEREIKDQLAQVYRSSLDERLQRMERLHFCFTGCEPFLHFSRMRKFLEIAEKLQRKIPKNIRVKIYTNGLPLDEKKLDILERLEVGEIELRFHPSASDFSERVMRIMEQVAHRNFRLTVEETLYPPNRKKLLAHLPNFEKLGIHHLLLKEPRIFFADGIERIINDYPQAKFYAESKLYMYSEGLPYQVFDKYLSQSHSYNIFYCNPKTISFRGVNESISRKLEEVDIIFDDNLY